MLRRAGRWVVARRRPSNPNRARLRLTTQVLRQGSGLGSSLSRPHPPATRSHRSSICRCTLIPMLTPSGKATDKVAAALRRRLQGGGCRSTRGCSSNPTQIKPISFLRKGSQGGVFHLTRGCRTHRSGSSPRKGRGCLSTISCSTRGLNRRNLSLARPTPTPRKGDGNHSTRGWNRRPTIPSSALRCGIAARTRAIHLQASRVPVLKLVQKARRHARRIWYLLLLLLLLLELHARRGAAANSRWSMRTST